MSAIGPRLPPKCTHCKAVQTTPEWSENAGESEVLYFWHCTACGHEFETRAALSIGNSLRTNWRKNFCRIWSSSDRPLATAPGIAQF